MSLLLFQEDGVAVVGNEAKFQAKNDAYNLLSGLFLNQRNFSDALTMIHT